MTYIQTVLVTLALTAGLVATATIAQDGLLDDDDEGLAEPAPSLHVDDQVTDGQTVTISRVNANQSSWLVVHADNDGSPGEVLGQSELLEEGLTVGVDVTVELEAAANETVRLHAMLHTDDGNGTYDFPGPDGPETDQEGSVVNTPFTVLVADAQVVVANGPAQIQGGDDDNGTGAEDLVPLDEQARVQVELVRLNTSSFVVIHLDDGGAPGAVVGFSDVLDAGEHEDVEVELNRSALPQDGSDFALWAMVHYEDGDGTYGFPEGDPPVVVEGRPVMTSFPAAFGDGMMGDGDQDNETGDGDDDVGGEVPGDGEDQNGSPMVANALLVLTLVAVVAFARRRTA